MNPVAWKHWTTRDADLEEAEIYAEKGPSVSRAAVGRIVSYYRSTEALLTGSRMRADIMEKMVKGREDMYTEALAEADRLREELRLARNEADHWQAEAVQLRAKQDT